MPRPNGVPMRALALCIVSLLLLPSCMVHESRELHRDYMIDYKTLSTPHEQKEMRVFAVANYCVGLLPKDEFFNSLSSFFAFVVAIPTGVVDLACFPLKWTYGALTLTQSDAPVAEAAPEQPKEEGGDAAPVPDTPTGTPEQQEASK